MSYFDNFMMKFMINYRIEAFKIEVNLLIHPFFGVSVNPHTCKNNDLYMLP